MIAKDRTVNFEGIHPRLVPAMFVADLVCRRVLGYEMVITSCKDGKHSLGSRHYVGCAWDVRTWTSIDSGVQIDNIKKSELAQELRAALGFEFFVFVEDDHIHISYKPQRWK